MRCLALLVLLTFLPLAAPAAGFDCANAGTRVERMVCASPELGALDERMAAAFKAIGPEATADAAWGRWAPRIDDQRRWLREVRDKCTDTGCLREAYRARIEALERWHEPAPIDAGLAARYVVEHTIGLVSEELQVVPARDCLALLPRADGGFELSIDSVQANGHTCAVSGTVRAKGPALHLVPGTTGDDQDQCALRVVVEHGELRVEEIDGSCRQWCGARARLGGLRFPRSTRQPGAAMACAALE